MAMPIPASLAQQKNAPSDLQLKETPETLEIPGTTSLKSTKATKATPTSIDEMDGVDNRPASEIIAGDIVGDMENTYYWVAKNKTNGIPTVVSAKGLNSSEAFKNLNRNGLDIVGNATTSKQVADTQSTEILKGMKQPAPQGAKKVVIKEKGATKTAPATKTIVITEEKQPKFEYKEPEMSKEITLTPEEEKEATKNSGILFKSTDLRNALEKKKKDYADAIQGKAMSKQTMDFTK